MTITTERLDALEAKATNQPLIPSYSGMLGDEGVKDVLLYLIAEIRRLQNLSEQKHDAIMLTLAYFREHEPTSLTLGILGPLEYAVKHDD